MSTSEINDSQMEILEFIAKQGDVSLFSINKNTAKALINRSLITFTADKTRYTLSESARDRYELPEKITYTIEAPAEDETLAAELPAIAETVAEFNPTHLLDGVPVEETDADGEARDVEYTNAQGESEWVRHLELSQGLRVKRIPDTPAPTMHTALIAAKDEHIARLEARMTELESQMERRETLLSKHREFVRDMCGYSFSDRDDARFVSDCVDELEGR